MKYTELFHWKEVVGFSIPVLLGSYFYSEASCEHRTIITIMLFVALMSVNIKLLKRLRDLEIKNDKISNQFDR